MKHFWILSPFFICFISSSFAEPVSINVNSLGRIINNSGALEQSYSDGVYAGRYTYGMRSNAVVAAFKANSGSPFDFPILGLPYIKALANYTGRDSVSLYADNTSPPFRAWERLNNVSFTPTSLSSNDIKNDKIKPGMIIDTDSLPKWSSYVVGIDKNKIITAGWVNTGTKRMGTPPDGLAVIINPITKIWATNFNLILPENGRANHGVIQENGIINNKINNPTVINGIDTVILPQSKYGGTAAYLARSAISGNKQRWYYGFISQGAVNNFTSSDALSHSPNVGYMENSKANIGLAFNGKNKDSSISWRDGNRVVAEIDPKGLINKFGYKTAVASTNMELSDVIARYLISADLPITLSLPRKEKIFPGYTLKLMKVSSVNTTITFRSVDGSKVNGNGFVKFTGKNWNKEAVFDGSFWYIY